MTDLEITSETRISNKEFNTDNIINIHQQSECIYEQSLQRFQFQDEYLQKLKFYGYSIIFFTWLGFIVTIGTIFNLWQWCFKVDENFLDYFNSFPWIKTIINDIKEQNKIVDNYYICIFCLHFVILWIWAVVSWISMKLFRHSKGGGS